MIIDFYYCTKQIKINNKIYQLTKTEFNILAYIYFRIGQYIDVNELKLYLYDSLYISDTVSVHIRRIKKKTGKIISCKRGEGYYITDSI